MAETPRGSRGISYSDVPTTVTVDFWVVDIGTTSVVVDAWHQSGSSADLVNQVAEVRDSITFVPAVVPLTRCLRGLATALAAVVLGDDPRHARRRPRRASG